MHDVRSFAPVPPAVNEPCGHVEHDSVPAVVLYLLSAPQSLHVFEPSDDSWPAPQMWSGVRLVPSQA